MTELRGQPSAGPAWGGHLALDAIVAYVDEELSSGAHRRALEHLSRCSECAAEVIAQTQARVALAYTTPCQQGNNARDQSTWSSSGRNPARLNP